MKLSNQPENKTEEKHLKKAQETYTDIEASTSAHTQKYHKNIKL